MHGLETIKKMNENAIKQKEEFWVNYKTKEDQVELDYSAVVCKQEAVKEYNRAALCGDYIGVELMSYKGSVKHWSKVNTKTMKELAKEIAILINKHLVDTEDLSYGNAKNMIDRVNEIIWDNIENVEVE